MPGQYDESKHKRDKGQFAHQQGAKGAEKPKSYADRIYEARTAGLNKARNAPAQKPTQPPRGSMSPDERGAAKLEKEQSGQRVEQRADQAKQQPDRGEMPEGAHAYIEAAHKSAAAAMQAVEAGDWAQISAQGLALQNSIKGMKAAGVPTEQLTAMRKQLVNLSQAIRTGGYVEAHEAATGLKHELFKLRHGSIGQAQKTVDAGSPNQPDPAFKKSLDTLKTAGVLDKAGYDKKLGEHVLSRQDKDKAGYKKPAGQPGFVEADLAAKDKAASSFNEPEPVAAAKKREGGKGAGYGHPPEHYRKLAAEAKAKGDHTAARSLEASAKQAERRGEAPIAADASDRVGGAQPRSDAGVPSIRKDAAQLGNDHPRGIKTLADRYYAGGELSQEDHVELADYYADQDPGKYGEHSAHHYEMAEKTGPLKPNKKKFAAKSWDDAKAQADLIEMSFEEYVKFKAPPAQKV